MDILCLFLNKENTKVTNLFCITLYASAMHFFSPLKHYMPFFVLLIFQD